MTRPTETSPPGSSHDASSKPRLERGLGLLQATSLNVANMIGIGPFITIPIFLSKMQGPQAMVGWVIGAALVICDGLVWSELAAALPGTGGTYHYFRETFGKLRWGRALPFLFIWQFLFTGALELASGYIGMADYLKYAFPGLEAHPWAVSGIASGLAIIVTLLLCRRTLVLGWVSVVLCAGTLSTVLIVIVVGLKRFDPGLIVFPENAFRLDAAFASGLGGAMLIAIYDYLGYYNVCHLGEEVKDPARTIPRAILLSTLLVAAIYLTMNIAIIGVVPWKEAMASKNVASLLMERVFSRETAVTFTWLILWTAFACVFVMTLGYSRVLYAAANRGDFFRVFAKLHPRQHYPWVSLLAIGAATAAFCFLPLEAVIDAAVTTRILIQFVGQIVALQILRTRRPDVPRPFRMWLYPLPSLVALIGWLFILLTREGWQQMIVLGVTASGVAVGFVWRRLSRASPLNGTPPGGAT